MALHEDQLEAFGERLVPLFQRFEANVITDIARRLNKTGRLTETAELMAQGLRRKGFSPSAIRSEVMRYIKADKALWEAVAQNTLEAKQLLQEEINELKKRVPAEIKAVIKEVGVTAWHNDLEAWKGDRLPVKDSAFEQVIEVMREWAQGEVLNLTKSMGFRTQTGQLLRGADVYLNSVNLAFTKVATGTFSYGQAIEDAVRELARSGIRVIDFASGTTRQADVAVRGAILTASSQLAGKITMHNIETTGVELVEVSKHWGARTGVGHGNHAAWQGGIYCVNGTDGRHRNLEEATGYPSDPKGLHGYNCRHVFYPFWEGISQPNQWPPEPDPVEINGKTYTYYQATQQQRKMEREIRALLREEYAYRAADMHDKAVQARSRARGLTDEYYEFSELAGISPKPARLRVVKVKQQ